MSEIYLCPLTFQIWSLNYSPLLWLHGHLHNSSMYEIGDCKVVCNPKGYPDELDVGFNSQLVVNV